MRAAVAAVCCCRWLYRSAVTRNSECPSNLDTSIEFDARGDQEAGCAMPQVVKAAPGQAGALQPACACPVEAKVQVGLSVSDGCRPFGPRVFRNGPLPAAGRAPKKPVPDVDFARRMSERVVWVEWHLGQETGSSKILRAMMAKPFHSRVVKATRHAPHDGPRGSSQTR